MNAVELRLLRLTAGDLMNREVKTLTADLPLREAAEQLRQHGVRGMPVVDAAGRVVGMLSMADLARWAADRHRNGPGGRACAFQRVERLPGGREEVLCVLPIGSCPFQREYVTAEGQRVLVCGEPQGIPTDWQVVAPEPPAAVVREVMTTTVRSVPPHTPVPELARRMLAEGIHRLLVTDPAGQLLGIVSADDLLQVLAHLDDERFAAAGETE